LFSLPESIKGSNSNIDPSALPSFNQILQQYGISQYEFKQQSIYPDPQKAKEILENYTRPVVIKMEENGSQLIDKFFFWGTISSRLSLSFNRSTNRPQCKKKFT